jgi:hypothetical protein
MQCPKCGFEQKDGRAECGKCGLIFRKYQKKAEALRPVPNDPGSIEPVPHGAGPFLKQLFFEVAPETNPLYFYGRALLGLVLLLWGGIFIFSSMGGGRAMNSLWHLVNLPFHEAGHIFFGLFGRFMTALGGSLFQLLMPVICAAVLLVKTRDPFGAAVCLWWLGENFMDLAPYINDARALQLPLLGGNTGASAPYGFHDWEFILTETGLLRFDHTLAQLSIALGIFSMLLALAWGGYLLFKQHQNL